MVILPSIFLPFCSNPGCLFSTSLSNYHSYSNNFLDVNVFFLTKREFLSFSSCTIVEDTLIPIVFLVQRNVECKHHPVLYSDNIL